MSTWAFFVVFNIFFVYQIFLLHPKKTCQIAQIALLWKQPLRTSLERWKEDLRYLSTKSGSKKWARKTLYGLTNICNIYKTWMRRPSSGRWLTGTGERRGNGQALVSRCKRTEPSLQFHVFSLSIASPNKAGQKGDRKKLSSLWI